MKVRIWGCRGSVAAPGPDTVRYGGNTSCVEVRLSDGTILVLDAGTGMRPLGLRLAEEGAKVIHVLLSHLHLDHLQGLAFFQPVYESDVELHIWGPPSPMHSLEGRIAGYMSEPLFPVNLSDIPCTATFHDATEAGWALGSATAWASAVSHQGPTLGYRLEEDGHAFVYIPDHEPSLGKDLRHTEVSWVSGYGLAAGADVLLHDAQYTESEYPNHIGWGHSSVEHVVTFATKSGVKQLVLFHHDPRHTDEQLEALLARATELWDGAGGPPPILAHEGMEFEI
jgi:phosphoribosyl 1,2-cyclic phosphodiesterase